MMLVEVYFSTLHRNWDKHLTECLNVGSTYKGRHFFLYNEEIKGKETTENKPFSLNIWHTDKHTTHFVHKTCTLPSLIRAKVGRDTCWMPIKIQWLK